MRTYRHMAGLSADSMNNGARIKVLLFAVLLLTFGDLEPSEMVRYVHNENAQQHGLY